MKISETIIRPDGTVETVETEVADNYFDAPEPEPVEPTEPEAVPDVWDEMAAAINEGVNSLDE